MKNALKRKYVIIFILTLIINPGFSQKRISISQEDADHINSTAKEKLKYLANYLEMIGGRHVEENQRRKIIETNIAEVANMSLATFSNDLDPTNQSPDNFGIQEYFENISIFYPDSMGVIIQLDSMRYKNEVYYDNNADIVFSRITVRRSLKGNYNDNGNLTFNENVKDLDFFIEANLNHIGEDIQIISMAFHRDDLKLKRVKIDNKKESLFTSEDLRKLQNELDRQKRDLESWKNKIEAAQIRAETAEEAAKLAQKRTELVERELKVQKQKAEAAQQKAKNEEKEKMLIRKEKDVLKGMAERNRIVLKLGGGVAPALISDEDEEKNNIADDDFIGGLHLSASLNYRLGSVHKLKIANRGTSLSFFYQRDYFNEATTNYMLNTIDTDFVVAGNSTTSEFQGGLVFGQLVRLSAGVGQLIYDASVIRNNTPVEINVKEDYNVYTLGLVSPSLKNTVLVYFNLKGYHFSPVDRDSHFRLNLEIGLQLQIQ